MQMMEHMILIENGLNLPQKENLFQRINDGIEPIILKNILRLSLVLTKDRLLKTAVNRLL